ncbi:hypothetical protein [Aquabacterium sp.]|uniref:hypothetical protein n=1 Tax=Aquabacterium sp. TaxID=1872578 RepID=UPI002BEA2802|nr:hypothetical protein [Aquabacterium sp.]HSW08099.1 hypothetical protein [Aquabacterium sp.]
MINTTLRTLCATAAATLMLATTTLPAQAHNSAASELSAISALPVAVIVAAPALLLSGGAMLTVAAVEASAEGTVWVLERASDGARASVKLVGGSMVAVGTGVLVTSMAAGWVLSAAGQAIAFIPNEIGASLLYNERVTR